MNIAYIIVSFGITKEEYPSVLSPDKKQRDLFSFFRKEKKIFPPETIKNNPDFSLFNETETFCDQLKQWTAAPILPFYLHLSSTHEQFFRELYSSDAKEYHLFPLFPQFSYALSGIAAAFFHKMVATNYLLRFRWIKSYAVHPLFIETFQETIDSFLNKKKFKQEETILLFAARGIDPTLEEKGDLYKSECEISFKEILKAFPYVLGNLTYLSKKENHALFPSIFEACETISYWNQKRKNVLIIPMSSIFYEKQMMETIHEEIIPLLERKGYNSCCSPFLSSHPLWPKKTCEILKEKNFVNNQMLLYPNKD